MAYIREATLPVSVIETERFAKAAKALWGEEEKAEFIDYIARNPSRGDLVEGTGGLRKVRWTRPGTGKSGGARVIYYFSDPDHPIYLFLAYPKSVQDDLSSAAKAVLRVEVVAIKAAWRPRAGRTRRRT